jgi:hypothetical protein
MTWSRDELSRWVHLVEATSKDEADDLSVLGIQSVIGEEPLAQAFHALAREVHPDRWRGTFGATGSQRVVKAYARLTLAYARQRERFQLERRRGTLPPRPAGSTLPPRAGTPSSPGDAPRARAGNTDPVVRAQRVAKFISAADEALERADFTAAQLNLRLAVAADPSSAELRARLAEFEAVMRGR